MAIQYTLIEAKIVHPKVDTITGQRVILKADGNPKVTKTQVFNEDGTPDLELVVVDDGKEGVLARRPKWIETEDTEDIIEAIENADLPPDGITYKVEAWDDADEATRIELDFHIGKSAFEAVQPHQRSVIIAKEIEILFTKAVADWTEGLELS